MLASLPSVTAQTLGKEAILVPECTDFCHVPQALGKDQKTLDKGFAKCNTRQIAHYVYSVGKCLFAKCFLSGILPSTEIDAR